MEKSVFMRIAASILQIFQELTVGTLVNVKHQSGGSNDCIESTGWPYNKFIVHNTANN